MVADRLLLWAKTAPEVECRYHPLLFHMLDVAAVALKAWDECLPAMVRCRIASCLPSSASSTFVAFLAGAHDIGKACPGFQKRVGHLGQALGLPFCNNDAHCPHGCVSAHAIKEFLGPCPAASLFGQIVGGHHGVFPRSCDLSLGQDKLGNQQWKEARRGLLNELARIVGLDVEATRASEIELNDPFLVPLLAGFVSVVDWVASNQDFFPCVAECAKQLTISAEDYWATAQQQAEQALETLGWLPGVTFRPETEFGNVFKGFNANGLQAELINLVRRQNGPHLMIVEAPMGQGKTEAALYAADLAMCRGFARGMYVAMPTQATSNAMFERVLNDYLEKRGHSGKLNVQLVHGNAFLSEVGKAAQKGEIELFEPGSVSGESEIENSGAADLEAQSWFTARKRPLLAPFGVGTIDQSLLSVLKTKHWFVRMFGLAGKVVIFDEVHAYDAYMSTILDRLLHWLAELDCTVILLSATLPDARRRALAEAYSGSDDAEHKRYPRITLAKPRRFAQDQPPEHPRCVEVPQGESKSVKVTLTATDASALARTLAERLNNGGCAAVICNTVDRSIEVFQYLRANLQDTECLLFHARTLQMWRREREEEVLRKFGKNGHRPQRAVLVATQVVEQSLDLDFDLMVSEIAPIDLLLQRSGRLHRHAHPRPNGLHEPELIVLCDCEADGRPPETFGKGTEHVYSRYILLRTWLALRDRKGLQVPDEIEALIEYVYAANEAPEGDGWIEALEAAKEKMCLERSESEEKACRLLVSRPKDPSDLIEEFNDQLAEDEDPEVHATVRAATREGDPSITVIIVNLSTNPNDIDNVANLRWLLDRSVNLSHRGLCDELKKAGCRPKEWAWNASLRHAFCLTVDDGGQARVGGYLLTMEKETGLMIEKR